MPRNRHRFADNIIAMAYSSAPYLVMLLSVVTVASLLANTHAAATATLASNNNDEQSYLYINTSESSPVLEHGSQPGIDFFKSNNNNNNNNNNNPKVVEFYDPKCGACQAFKSNYIEIARKVQSLKPNVEFYGVSCELYRNICDKYGLPSVPKIFAFPNGARVEPDDGIEVPKGAGTIYFLSARLVKALRSPEEIASDVAKLKSVVEGGVEEVSSRRLEDSVSGDEEGEVSEEEDDEEGSGSDDNDDAITVEEDVIISEDDSGDDSVVSEDGEEEDKGPSYGSEDLLSEDNNRGGGGEPTEELSEDKDGESEDIVKRRPPPPVRDNTPPSKESQNRHRAAVPSSGQDVPSEKQGQQQQHPSSKRSQDNNPTNKKKKLNRSEHVRHTDAYKNTVREFEKMDERKGKPKGYHYNKMKEDRDAHFNNVQDAQKIAAQQVPTVRQQKPQQQQQQPQQSVGGGTATTDEREAQFNKVKAANEKRKAENDKRLRDARAIEAEKFAGSRQEPVVGEGTAAKEQEAREERSSVSQGENPGSRQSIRGNKPITNDGQPTHSGPKPIFGKPRGQADAPQNPLLPPHDQIAVGGDHVVNPFSNDPERAKKFNEYLARRKQKLERQEKLKHPIKSIIGGARKGTDVEEEDISAIHAKKSPMRNYKSQYKPQPPRPAPGFKKPDLRPEAQHKTIRQKVLKKIPIVNRAFKRSKGEETLNDAALSFKRGLIMGVFKNNVPLDYKRRTALVDWLDLLRVSLPPEIGLHELIDTLKYDVDKISQRQENLLEVINKHPLPDHQWSNDCTKGTKSGGFFCGFWKLLHVMSVGFAEQAGGLALQEASPSIRVFSPHEAGDVVREYMAFFFNCEECSTRFIGKYDDCSFDRCRLLGDETVGASEETWQEFPLWLWQVHNEISVSKLDRATDFHKKLGRKAEAKKWELSLKTVYPHIDQCISCVTEAGTWKLNRVYRHLEKEYWTFGSEASLDPKMEKFLKHTDIERGNVSHGLGVYIFVVLLALLTLLAKKYRIRATGRRSTKQVPKSFSQNERALQKMCTFNVEVLIGGCTHPLQISAPAGRIVDVIIDDLDSKEHEDDPCVSDYEATLNFPVTSETIVLDLNVSGAVETFSEFGSQCSRPVVGRPFVDAKGGSLHAMPWVPDDKDDSMVSALSWTGEDSVKTQISRVNNATNHGRVLLGEDWIQRALGEHASIASFSAFSIALMSNGAPAVLVNDALKAGLDEVRHARTSFEIASKLAAREVGPGPLPESNFEFGQDLKALALSVAREGCLDETLSAFAAAVEVGHINEVLDNEMQDSPYSNIDRDLLSSIKNELVTIAMDESNHSALAWRTLSWVCSVDSNVCDEVNMDVFEESNLAMRFNQHADSSFGETSSVLHSMKEEWKKILTAHQLGNSGLKDESTCEDEDSVYVGEDDADESLLTSVTENIIRQVLGN